MSSYKVLPKRLSKQSNNILNKNERLATNLVAPTPSSIFDKSFRHLTTFNSSKLVPIYVDECLPGDIFNIDITTLIRLSTPNAATMENPIYDIFFFFVPNRIVWENWKYFMGENKDAGFQKAYKTIPIINYDLDGFKYDENDLASYLGIPLNVNMKNVGVPISSLFFKAYGKIWNDYFRDQNIMSEIDITNNDNNDNNVNVSDYMTDATTAKDYNVSIQIGKGLAPATRLPDYFSTCLPYPQKGDNVDIGTLPLNNLLVNIPNLKVVNDFPNPDYKSKLVLRHQDGSALLNGSGSSYNQYTTLGVNDGNVMSITGQNFTLETNFDRVAYTRPGTNSKTDIPADQLVRLKDGYSPYNVNDLRLSLAIQHMRETDARNGTRYIEYLLSHFGVQTSDSRLDRAESIGGFRSNININNIVQSSAGTASSPLGVLGGVSVSSDKNPRLIEYAVKEHGIIMGFVVVRPQINYSQGLEKKFTRIEKLDFYDPLLANIGEQPVKKYELFLSDRADGNTNNEIFGYNESWADYRYSFNKLSGYVSANSPNSLVSLYAYTEKYGNAPVLGDAWMYPDDSIIGNTLYLNSNKVEYIHQFLGDFYFNVRTERKLPVYSIPGLKKV